MGVEYVVGQHECVLSRAFPSDPIFLSVHYDDDVISDNSGEARTHGHTNNRAYNDNKLTGGAS